MKYQFLAALILATASSHPSCQQLTNKLLTKHEMAAKQAIKAQLKDPGSAIFDALTSYTASNTQVHICGYVNAKNSYGGYAGASPFVAIYAHNVIVFASLSESSVDHFCTPAKIEASIAKDRAEKIEDDAATCKPTTNEATPGPCGELYKKCKSRLRFLNEYEKSDFMRFCRIKGYESAADRWGVPDPLIVK